MTDAKARLLQMIADEPHMGGGGLLKAVGKAQKVAKAAKPAKTAAKVIEAPSIVIPSRLSNLKDLVRGQKGEYGAKRVERAADEIPNLERMYKEEALRQAFTGNNAAAMMTLDPALFEEYATPITSTFTRPNSIRHTASGEQVTYPEYIEYLKSVGGFDDVPFLQINKQLQGTDATPYIFGHEGRHRNRALSQSGEKSGLVQILPRSELREPFPRRTQEDYIEALRKELEMTGNIVLPQTNLYQPNVPQRPAIRMPDIYAEGGNVQKAGGGLLKALSKAQKVAKATQPIVSAAEHEANLARLLEPSKATMRLYHGTTATEGGKGTEAIRRLKPSKEGALGSGVYLTPSTAHASGYSGIPNDEALELMMGNPSSQDLGLKALNQRNSGNVLPAQQGGNMLPVYAQIKNPLILEGHPEPGRYRDPMIEALTKLGVDEDKATKMVERAYDQKGYIGKEVESRARAAGYDGIMQYRNGELSEVVSYNPNAIKSATGNSGAFDINDPDLSKAHGGAVHMAGGGRTPKYPWERYPQPKKVPEMRARQINPVAGAVKKGADYATQLIDKGPSFSSLVGNLVGAVPFVGPDLRKRMEASDISIPTDITMPSFMPEYMSEQGTPVYKQAGIEMGKIPAKDLMEIFKVSDFTPFAGLSNVAESIGYGQMPDALDLLDTVGVGALGYGAVKAGVKGAGALSNLAKSDTGYKLAQKALDYVPGAQPMYAVKPKGGNWVDTEVKRQLNNLKNDEDYSPLLVNSSKQDLAEMEKNSSAYPNSALGIELLRNDIARMEETNAFNKWVDTKAGSYIRNQMGTPDDPVVKSIDMRAMKAQADLEAGQKRLAALDGRIAEAEKTAVTPDELNQLAGMKRNRSQRAAELQSNYDLTLETMLPGGKSNQGYSYLGNHNYYLDAKRTEAGFPVEGYAQTRPAKAWEALTDANISINPAEMFQNPEAKLAALKQVEDEYKNYRNVELKDKFRDFVMSQPNLKDSTRRALIDGSSTKHMAEMVGDTERHEKLLDDVYEAQRKVNNSSMDAALDNPYLAKLPPEAPVYMLPGISELGIDHVIDVLKQDVAAGNIKLEDLNKITMEQALKRASEYDLDLAKKARDSIGASRAAMPVYKEYPEGYKWVQLTKPGEFRQESEEMGHSVKGYEPPKGHPDWSPNSENSGNENYGHGGWEAIKSGQAKVYSLVDANHKPHVTIEVRQNPADKSFGVNQMPQGNDFYTQNNIYIEGQRSGEISPDMSFAEWWRSTQGIAEPEPPPPIITQIKGKGNARPAAKYDQYTQDFVRSGNWGRVERDLKNTGLIESNGRYFTEPEFAEAAKKYGVMGVQDVPWEVARQRHIDAGIPEDEAFINWLDGLREGRGRLDIPDEPRMAEGGEVKSFFEEKSAKQRLLDMIAEEPHMAGGGLLKAVAKAQKTAKAVKAAESALKIKPPSDNILNVRQANFQYPKTVGNQTVSIDKLSGGVRMTSASEKQRVNDLANKISSPEGYISRLIVDHNNNVIEGQHRLEALRQLGIKDVPVYKIEELADTMPVSKMEAAVKSVGSIHSDHVGQLVSHALEHIAEGGIDSARKMNYGKFQKHYDAALDAAVESKKTSSAAPQDEALRLAQQRAALPIAQGGLGLPANNTPAQRATAMGFDADVYHGSKQDFNKFKGDQPIFAAEDPEIARLYGSFIYPLKLRGKVLEISDLGKDGAINRFPNNLAKELNIPRKELKDLRVPRQQFNEFPFLNKLAYLFNNKFGDPQFSDIGEREMVNKLPRYGIDRLKVTDMSDMGGTQTQHMIPAGSENIRSRFAAFDPFRRNAATAAAMGVAAPDLLADEKKAAGGEVHMGKGGVLDKFQKLADAAKAAKKAAEVAPYLPGVHYADPLLPPNMRLSEALGNAGAEGKTLNFTETDRSRVHGPNRGGAGFAGLQNYSLPHKKAKSVWGFGNDSTATKKINLNDPENTIWTTYAGSPNQHKSNSIVVKDAMSQLQLANQQGGVNSKQVNLINERIRSAVNDKGNLLFPENFDITDPKAFDFATTFDRRAAISDALMGIGVKKPMISKEFKAANPGVKWQDAANIEAILRRETDPVMVDANTFDVGPNLFVLDNGIIHRPDLNEAFPTIVTGTDLGMRYELAPFRDAAPDWIKARGIKPNEPINAWAMSRAAPSQFVSDKYLTGLQKKGRKEGGLAQIKKVKRHGNTVSN